MKKIASRFGTFFEKEVQEMKKEMYKSQKGAELKRVKMTMKAKQTLVLFLGRLQRI